MTTIYDVDPSKLIEKVSEELKKIDEIKAPEWAKYAKTGASKERPPIEEDWWYARTASILRKIYMLGPIGVSKLRKKYWRCLNRTLPIVLVSIFTARMREVNSLRTLILTSL